MEKTNKVDAEEVKQSVKVYEKGLTKSRQGFVSKLANLTNKYSKITDETLTYYVDEQDIITSGILNEDSVDKYELNIYCIYRNYDRNYIGLDNISEWDNPTNPNNTKIYNGIGEELKIQQNITSIASIIKGVKRAIIWSDGKPNGFYTMQDVLKI